MRGSRYLALAALAVLPFAGSPAATAAPAGAGLAEASGAPSGVIKVQRPGGWGGGGGGPAMGGGGGFKGGGPAATGPPLDRVLDGRPAWDRAPANPASTGTIVTGITRAGTACRTITAPIITMTTMPTTTTVRPTATMLSPVAPRAIARSIRAPAPTIPGAANRAGSAPICADRRPRLSISFAILRGNCTGPHRR